MGNFYNLQENELKINTQSPKIETYRYSIIFEESETSMETVLQGSGPRTCEMF